MNVRPVGENRFIDERTFNDVDPVSGSKSAGRTLNSPVPASRAWRFFEVKGETRELLIQFQIPGIESLGEHTLGDFLIDFVTLPGLEQSNITWPICVNVGSVDQAKSRIPNPTVTTAMLITQSAKAQREVSENLRRGETKEAAQKIQERLDHMSTLPNRELVEDEIIHLTKLIKGIQEQDANRMSKSLYEDSASNLRGRNRDQVRQQRSRGKRDF